MKFPRFRLRDLLWVTVLVAIGCGWEVHGQEHISDREPEPFQELDRLVKQDIAWSGTREPLAAAFRAERERLGDRFKPELMKFIAANPTRHYWCGLFLTSHGYLAGAPRDGLLAIAVWEQGILLEKRGKNSHDRLRSFHEFLAIECAKQQLKTRASFHKAHAEYQSEIHHASGPATSEQDTEIYESITPLPDVRLED